MPWEGTRASFGVWQTQAAAPRSSLRSPPRQADRAVRGTTWRMAGWIGSPTAVDRAAADRAERPPSYCTREGLLEVGGVDIEREGAEAVAVRPHPATARPPAGHAAGRRTPECSRWCTLRKPPPRWLTASRPIWRPPRRAIIPSKRRPRAAAGAPRGGSTPPGPSAATCRHPQLHRPSDPRRRAAARQALRLEQGRAGLLQRLRLHRICRRRSQIAL